MDSQISATLMDLEYMLIDESAEPKALPLSLLDEITSGFSENQEIGRGGFAVVYKGNLGNGMVAVKKLSDAHIHETEFHREVECLMSVKHNNIVRFLGYCADTQGSMQRYNKRLVMADVQQRLLCFDYVPNGSLLDYITDSSCGLEWRKRYKVIKGVCDGLNYLHKNRIVHLDLKPANILMDDNMEPKIADFGLSRCFDEEQSRVMATKVAGTLGYLPPEFMSRVITRAYDIYSLGVIIIEILTGKKGYHETEDVVDSWKKRLEESHDDSKLEQIRVCAKIGKECTKNNPAKRPCSVQDIVDRLEETESADESSVEQMRPSIPTERGLLHVHECQLRFPVFKPDKLISSPLRLTNDTNDPIAFRCFPKLPENSIDGLSKLQGIVPRRTTRTFLIFMEKQPPEDIEAFDVILESCVAHKAIVDGDDHFLPEIRKRLGSKVHQVPLVAVCNPAGEIICCIPYESRLTSMDAHPTEPWILAAHTDGYVSIWNYETQERMVALKLAHSIARACTFVARENWIVVGDGNGDIHVRSCKTMENWIVVGDGNGVHVHSRKRMELEEVMKINADGDWIQALAVHPSLPLLLSGGKDGRIKLWNWEKGWTCIRKFIRQTAWVEALVFNPQNDSPDAITFASAVNKCGVKIWDTSSSLPIATLDCKGDNMLSVDYFPPGGNGQYIVGGPEFGKARIWNLRTNKCVREIKQMQGDGCKVCVVDCLPDPPVLITVLEGHNIGLCNTTTYRYKNIIDFELGFVRAIVYIKGIRSVVIGLEGGLAMLEID